MNLTEIIHDIRKKEEIWKLWQPTNQIEAGNYSIMNGGYGWLIKIGCIHKYSAIHMFLNIEITDQTNLPFDYKIADMLKEEILHNTLCFPANERDFIYNNLFTDRVFRVLRYIWK